MNKQECAIIMAHTGITMLQGSDFRIFHEYIEKIMGRPIFIHEMPRLEEEIKEKSKSDFIKLCENATDK